MEDKGDPNAPIPASEYLDLDQVGDQLAANQEEDPADFLSGLPRVSEGKPVGDASSRRQGIDPVTGLADGQGGYVEPRVKFTGAGLSNASAGSELGREYKGSAAYAGPAGREPSGKRPSDTVSHTVVKSGGKRVG